MRSGRKLLLVLIPIVLAASAWMARHRIVGLLRAHGVSIARTVSQVQAEHGEQARRSYEETCRSAGVAWPPARMTLLAFKEERTLEVWAANPTGPFTFLREYMILAASGGPGPKRREGDLQVPEGVYGLPVLNPNSRFHLSIRVDYPNAEDIRHARVARKQMGGDIYIHGGAASIGCIAIGNGPIEEVFCLAAQVPVARLHGLAGRADQLLHPGEHRHADGPGHPCTLAG